MRAKYEGKEFRDYLLGGAKKGDGVFFKEDEWKDFHKNHTEIIENATLEKEEDWKLLSKKLRGNLSHTRKQLESAFEDNNIVSILNAISTKVDNLEKLVKDKLDIDTDAIDNLKIIEKRLYSIRKEFE